MFSKFKEKSKAKKNKKHLQRKRILNYGKQEKILKKAGIAWLTLV